MAYYKTTYGAEDAPEPHNGVSYVEYLARFPYNPILVTHTVLKTETKAKTIVSFCVISTVMINKKRNIDHCIDFYLPFRWTIYRVRLFSSPDLCSDSASKRGFFIGCYDCLLCVLWSSDNTDFTLVLRLLMLQFIVELVIITQNCFSSSLVSKFQE